MTKYKIVNKLTGKEYKTDKEIKSLFEDFEKRGKGFRLVNLFNDTFADLKIVPVIEVKKFRDELSEFLEWIGDLTPTGLHEAEREILDKIQEIKSKEGFY